MNQDHLPPIREPLDPGIAIAVWLLRGHGLPTVDSGDGYSKVEALEIGEAIGYGHVFIQVGDAIAADMIATATAIPWEERGYHVPTVELLLGKGEASDPDLVAVVWKPGELHKVDPGVVPVAESAEYRQHVEADSPPPSANLCGGTGQNYDPLAYEGFSGDCRGCDGCRVEEPTGDAPDGAKGGCRGCDESCEAWARCGAQTDPTGHAATIAALQEKLSKAIEERDEARDGRKAMAEMGLKQVATAGNIADQLVAARVTIANLEQKLRVSIEERVAERNLTRDAHSELYAIQERTMELFCNMGIGHSPMNLYDRVLTLLPRKRVTQWLSMKLAEARLEVERRRFENPGADDSLDVIKGAIMVEAEAHRRLRRHLDGPPSPPAKVL